MYSSGLSSRITTLVSDGFFVSNEVNDSSTEIETELRMGEVLFIYPNAFDFVTVKSFDFVKVNDCMSNLLTDQLFLEVINPPPETFFII